MKTKVTLYFTKRIVRGILKGIVVNETISFPDENHALDWVRGVKANCRDWELVDYSFQKYWR